jgi:hypothetical protein
MMYRRHMARFGTTSEDLAHVAVAFRDHATRNPAPVMQKPIAVDDHQNSRFICDPLHLLDYCLIDDGGVAWIMTAAERAKDMKQKPVYVSGYARQDDFSRNSYPADEFWYPALQKVAFLRPQPQLGGIEQAVDFIEAVLQSIDELSVAIGVYSGGIFTTPKFTGNSINVCRPSSNAHSDRQLARSLHNCSSDTPIATDVAASFSSAAHHLGSALVDQSQRRTVAARAMAEKKTVGHRS